MHKTDTHRDQMTTEARDGANPGVGSEPKKVSKVNDQSSQIYLRTFLADYQTKNNLIFIKNQIKSIHL